MRSNTLPAVMMEKEIKDNAVCSATVHFAIQNNGDGSVSVRFFKTREAASKFDENYDDGWGENCSDTKELHFDKDGILINAHVEDKG